MKAVYNMTFGALLSLALAGCGGGGSGSTSTVSGIGGTGKVVTGTITGFGSIFVNGVEYEIDTANISVDDADALESDLRIGMIVTLDATVSGTTGVASVVTYDDDVDGPVSGLTTDADGLTKTFSVLGTTVTIDSVQTRFDDGTPGFGFDTIADNDVVEVSGFFDASNVLQASYIEKKSTLTLGTTEVELKGTVSGAPAGGAGTGDNFTINGVTVNILATADLSDMPGNLVNNGDFVEAKGILTGATSIDADEVELESEGLGDDVDDVSVEGFVTDFVDASNFRVAGQPVDASNATFEPSTLQLEDGLKVEVEGAIVNGTLIADEVEARSADIKISAGVSALSVSGGTVTLQLGDGDITVTFDNQTKFEDDTGAVENPTLADLSIGDFLELSGYLGSSGVVASEVQRTAVDDVILQGPVDSFVASTSITILGVSFFTNGLTSFEDSSDASITENAFYTALTSGDTVKIKDSQPDDGSADEVDQED